MQERSLSGTASDEEGIEIHRTVLICFLTSMLSPGVQARGTSRIEVDCRLQLEETAECIGDGGL